MKKAGNLTYNNLKKGFLESLKQGDVFTYASSFDARSVEQICYDKGIVVEYMHPKTEEYKTFGGSCMKVVYFLAENHSNIPVVTTDTICMTPEHLDALLKGMFLKGEEWGVAYSTWFTPSEEKHDIEYKQAKEEIIENFKTNNPDVL